MLADGMHTNGSVSITLRAYLSIYIAKPKTKKSITPCVSEDYFYVRE